MKDGRDVDLGDLERRLAESEQRLRETQALARIGSWEWTIDATGEMQATYSLEMQRIFGRDPEGPPPTREELIEYILPEDRPAFERLVARIRTTTGLFEHSYRIVDGEGRVRHMQARGHVEAGPNGSPARTYGTTQDITELKESQAQLEHARRMEAVGQLAGGIAHDFNNMLSVILNRAEYALGADDAEKRNSLREIERAALSAADLTRQLLLFGRHDVDELRSVDLSAVVAETEEMLRRTIGDNIELTVDAPRGLPAVELGEGQARQILINLVVNARDALRAGGTIKVSVREEVGVGPDETPCLVLTVADNGVGMSGDVAKQAFDPFFTTKPRGQGTGLGLATVYGIATKAGGRVGIESEPGGGAVVSTYLPTSAVLNRPARRPPQETPRGGGGQVVLVVDNEEAVQTIVCHMLRKNGYRTRSASSGREAESIAIGAQPPVDLLLTDVLMPGMSGTELARRVQASMGISTIFMSGYADSDVSPQTQLDDCVTILQKPFTAAQLLRAIGEALSVQRRFNSGSEARE